MDIKIKYADITERCKMFSEYEAREGSGDVASVEVILTDSDDTLLRELAEEALGEIESVLGGALECDMDFGSAESESATMVIGKGKEVAGGGKATGSFVKSIGEAASSYIMYKWLLNKMPERSKTYQNMFADMSVVVKKLAWKRTKPKMEE